MTKQQYEALLRLIETIAIDVHDDDLITSVARANAERIARALLEENEDDEDHLP